MAEGLLDGIRGFFKSDDASRSEAVAQPRPVSREVGSLRFIGQIHDLVQKKAFLYECGVVFRADHYDLLDLSDLQTFVHKDGGRAVTAAEWSRVNAAMAVMAGYLTADHYHRLRVLQTRQMVGALPRWLLFFAIFGVILPLVPAILPTLIEPVWRAIGLLAGYLIWTITLGLLGAAAFLAVNSLSARNDANFDLADPDLIKIRLVLGAVFGFVLGLPFSMPGFSKFVDSMAIAARGDATGMNPDIVVQLLLPFFLGFSTSFVLTVLDRAVSAAGALFGVSSAPPATTPTPVAQSPSPPSPSLATSHQATPSESVPAPPTSPPPPVAPQTHAPPAAQTQAAARPAEPEKAI